MTVDDLHDAALYAWRGAGVRDAVLVHVDAHHDADALEWDFVTISNFVWWALREGIVREVFWVVPDPSWDTRSGPAVIAGGVAALARQHQRSADVDVRRRSVHATVAGRPFTACALSTLPHCGDVLLDIDVDYFLISDIAEELPPVERSRPWTWPADLIAGLRGCGIRPRMTTIATSTRGGFTPLEWKYLGEELAARLSDAQAHGYDTLRRGAEAEQRGDREWARVEYGRAVEALPASPGARYRLARLHLSCGNVAAARAVFAEVLERDSSYRASDSAGKRWHAAGNDDAAREAYTDVLRIDPANHYAHVGLGRMASACGDHTQAIGHFERALSSTDVLVDAHRGIAGSLESVGDVAGAIRHYERSIRLELLGHTPLDAPLATRPRVPRVFDEGHWRAHRRLASLQRDAKWLAALEAIPRWVVAGSCR